MRAHELWLDQILILGLCSLIAGIIPPAAIAQGAATSINLVVVQGDGAIHDNQQPATSDIIVRVEDDDHQPIPGVSVVFALPISGASGAFFNNSPNLSTVTGEEGLAIARGLKVNHVPGKFQIYVTASYGSLHSEMFITQFIKGMPPGANAPDLRSKSSGAKWKWIALAVVAAGAAGGSIYYLNTRASSSRQISVTAGSVQFGSPR